MKEETSVNSPCWMQKEMHHLSQERNASSLPAILLVLEWSGYNAALKVQPASAIQGIQALIGPIPAMFLLLGIGLALYYPLNREQHAQVISDIALRKANKKG
jgi:Na+/melibiose symporter-like transporter